MIRAVAQAISCGDKRFRAVKLLCKSSSEKYLTWSFKFACFDCLETTKSNHSCEHSFNRYIFRDSFAIIPSALSKLVEVSAEPVLSGTMSFSECFPIYSQYLESHRYLNYLSGTDLLTKGSMPFLSLEAGEQGDKFLKSTEFIEKSSWVVNRFGNQVDDASYEKCKHFWLNLKEYEKKEKGKSLCWLEMFRVYCLSDSMFLISILKKYVLDAFQETGRNLLNFLSLASFSMRIFMDVAKKEGQPVLSQYNARIFQLIERQIQGGVTLLNSTRINTNNCSFLPEHNPEKPSAYHLIVDQNSQYSNSMQNFSHGYSDFVINTRTEMRQTCEDINNGSWRYWTEDAVFSQKDRNGDMQNYIQFYVVSLKLPKEHQDKLKSLPPVFVKRCPKKVWLSKHSRASMNYMKSGRFEDDADFSNSYTDDQNIDAIENVTNSFEMSQLRLLPVLGNVSNYAVNHR